MADLVAAAGRGDLDAVRELLADPYVDVNWQQSIDSHTALVGAAAGGHLDVVRELLAVDGIDPNWTTYDSPPIVFAAAGGHAEVVLALARAGANVNFICEEETDGQTALYEAARTGSAAVVAALLQPGVGADVNLGRIRGAGSEYEDGETPLLRAAQNGHLAIVRLLLDAGADTERDLRTIGCTPLYMAAARPHPAAVRLLLRRGADVDCVREVAARQRSELRGRLLGCLDEACAQLRLRYLWCWVASRRSREGGSGGSGAAKRARPGLPFLPPHLVRHVASFLP